MPGGPGGKLGGGMNGAAGMIGGTNVEAMLGVAGGNPGTAADGGIPSFEAIVFNWANFLWRSNH